MRPRPTLSPFARWRDYLGLAVFLALLTVPFPIAAGVAGAMVAARTGLAMRRALRRHRAAGAAAPGASVALGRDPAGRPVTLSDHQLGAHALIVGASGSGKSTTMLAVLADHIAAGRPVVAIDMKGSPGFARELGRAAARAGRRLAVWTPDGPSHWNPLAHGNPTALKDMLISTERFTEPHYQRAAERYLQLAITVLHAAHPGRAAQLDEVVTMMEPKRLERRLRELPSGLAAQVGDYLGGLTRDQESAIRGLGTRLALLSESNAGRYLAPGDGPAVDLRRGLEGGDVILLSLNSSVYGQLAAQLGALAIQGLTSAAGYRLKDSGEVRAGVLPATVAIDEFSALGADNVLALLARGREAGVTTLIATQELSDLERAGRGFRDQVMGIVGVVIAHRQRVDSSATLISGLAGTEWVWEETRVVRSGLGTRPGQSRGTRRLAEQPVVHPNEIKTLAVGRAVLFADGPASGVTRLVVKPPRPAGALPAGPEPPGMGPTPSAGPVRPLGPGPTPPGPAPRPAGSRLPASSRGTPGPRREPPDQAAPGVTR
jgi:conjugal transfer pilus assembly protein TraD